MRHGNRAILRAQTQRVGTCFSRQDVSKLAQHMRQYYCSCLWKPGDILLVDNLQIVHAGMPGAGQRTVRAMICNALEMDYNYNHSGVFKCKEIDGDTIGKHMVDGFLLNPP